jgi:hypothetical protein
MVYNAILRRFPLDLYSVYADGENTFSTTIFVLVSAVQRIARAMQLPEGLIVYRGLGGQMDLPLRFFEPDSSGCLGFAEWGFMSTTADKRVAIQYSGVREGRPRATILVITCGAVDRGACIRDFSQYPSEIEYLWLPCSFVQPSGSRFVEVSSSGVVTMVPVRVNANLKTMTVEEILGQKKAMHLASFRYLQGELKRDLEHIVETEGGSARLLADTSPKKSKFSVRGFLRHIQKQGQEVYERHCAVEAAGYIGDDDYRALVTEMLDVKAFALSKLLWWLSDRLR